jgi:hypothetical protein
MRRVRYIGFDMDDCVGHVHPLHPFTNEFHTRDDDAFVKTVAQRFAACEIKRRTGFFRPAMIPVVQAVYRAIKSGQIRGAFLFSNNDNHSLVLFIKDVLEAMAQQLLHLRELPTLFLMSISFQSPERGPRTAIKDWKSITQSMTHHGLPHPTSHNDLLFFDDKKHVLTAQIPHYTVVPAYADPVELEDFLKCVHTTPGSPPHWARWMASRVRTRVHTPERVPTEDEGTSVFLGAMERFLKAGGSLQKAKGTKKANNRRRSYKNRRLL